MNTLSSRLRRAVAAAPVVPGPWGTAAILVLAAVNLRGLRQRFPAGICLAAGLRLTRGQVSSPSGPRRRELERGQGRHP